MPAALYALAAYAAHAIVHVRSGHVWDMFWACNVAPLLMVAGCLLTAPRLLAVSILWLTYGTPIWIIDLATGGEVLFTSFLTHLGCPLLGLLAAREIGFPKNSWLFASAGILALMIVCRFVTPADANINLSHAVWAGWEKQFPRYDVYFAVIYGGATATFFLAEKLWTRLL